MIKVYSGENLVCDELNENNLGLLKNAVWIDVLSPSTQEEKLLEKNLNIEIPTKRRRKSLEVSNRIYKHQDSLCMTAMMLSDMGCNHPEQHPVTFILTNTQLITIRSIEPRAFTFFVANRGDYDLTNAPSKMILLGLLEVITENLAGNMELVGEELDLVSQRIFDSQMTRRHSIAYYKIVIRKIGLQADLNNKLRESLITYNRLVAFWSEHLEENNETKLQLKNLTLLQDMKALGDYANFISTKINFLLDATLGLINIEQGVIIKIFSIAAVIFLPPTLIASVYGMNFKNMPELSWEWGYGYALVLMFLSAIVSYKFFKYKKWL